MVVTVITILLKGPSFGQYEVGTNNGSSPPRPHPLPPTQLPFFAPVHGFKWVFFFFVLVLILCAFCVFVFESNAGLCAHEQSTLWRRRRRWRSAATPTGAAAAAMRPTTVRSRAGSRARTSLTPLAPMWSSQSSARYWPWALTAVFFFSVPAKCSMKRRFRISPVLNCFWEYKERVFFKPECSMVSMWNYVSWT